MPTAAFAALRRASATLHKLANGGMTERTRSFLHDGIAHVHLSSPFDISQPPAANPLPTFRCSWCGKKIKPKLKLAPPAAVWALERDILFAVSGVFCIAMPVRVLELFQEMLQGGSDMSLRAEGMQDRSTDKEKTKEKGFFLKAICPLLHCWNVSLAFEWCELSCLSATRRFIRPRTDAYQRWTAFTTTRTNTSGFIAVHLLFLVCSKANVKKATLFIKLQ